MRLTHYIFTFGLVCSSIAPGYGAVVYDESVSVDFSNAGLSPTTVAVGAGANEILGTTGNLDRDYFTIHVAEGLSLDSITLLPGTVAGGEVSFIGLQAGSQVTVSPNTGSAAGLLGWWHYSDGDIGTDILGKMATPSLGSSGFLPPLGSGDYAFWVQDFNVGSSPYGLALNLSQLSVPLPGAGLTFLSGIGLLGMMQRRRSRYIYI